MRAGGFEGKVAADLAREKLANREAQPGAAGSSGAAGLEKVRTNIVWDSVAFIADSQDRVPFW